MDRNDEEGRGALPPPPPLLSGIAGDAAETTAVVVVDGGGSCLAPDLVLVPRERAKQLCDALVAAIVNCHGAAPRDSAARVLRP